MDQSSKIHGDGVRKTLFSGFDVLAVDLVQKNHAQRPHAESRKDASDDLTWVSFKAHFQ